MACAPRGTVGSVVLTLSMVSHVSLLTSSLWSFDSYMYIRAESCDIKKPSNDVNHVHYVPSLPHCKRSTSSGIFLLLPSVDSGRTPTRMRFENGHIPVTS